MCMKRPNGITVPLHQQGNLFNPTFSIQNKKKLLKNFEKNTSLKKKKRIFQILENQRTIKIKTFTVTNPSISSSTSSLSDTLTVTNALEAGCRMVVLQLTEQVSFDMTGNCEPSTHPKKSGYFLLMTNSVKKIFPLFSMLGQFPDL